MKRHTLRILLCLLLGIVSTVCVAWSTFYWRYVYHTPPNYKDGYTRNGPGFSDWHLSTWGASGFSNAFSNWTNGISTFKAFEAEDQAESVLPDWAGFAYPSGTYPQNTNITRLVDARGWPSLALWSGREVVGFPAAGATVGSSISTTNGYLLPSERNIPFSMYIVARILPFAPIWPGFLIDTFFYAAIWFGLMYGYGPARRAIRRKRGRCIKCGYNLSGDFESGCSECGWNRAETEKREVEQ